MHRIKTEHSGWITWTDADEAAYRKARTRVVIGILAALAALGLAVAALSRFFVS